MRDRYAARRHPDGDWAVYDTARGDWYREHPLALHTFTKAKEARQEASAINRQENRT